MRQLLKLLHIDDAHCLIDLNPASSESLAMLVAGLVQGREVQSQQAVDLYNILSESDTNLRQPVGMENQLLKDSAMDSDVAQSMIQLLQVRTFMGWELTELEVRKSYI